MTDTNDQPDPAFPVVDLGAQRLQLSAHEIDGQWFLVVQDLAGGAARWLAADSPEAAEFDRRFDLGKLFAGKSAPPPPAPAAPPSWAPQPSSPAAPAAPVAASEPGWTPSVSHGAGSVPATGNETGPESPGGGGGAGDGTLPPFAQAAAPHTLAAGDLSADGHWRWNGTSWEPASAPPPA